MHCSKYSMHWSKYSKGGSLLSFFLAVVIVNQISRTAFRLPMSIYYAVLIAIGGLVLVRASPLKANMKMFLLWGCMWVSILFNINTIPPIYKVSYRTLSFFLVMLAFGPFFNNERLFVFRIKMLNHLNLLLLGLTILCFFGKIAGGGGSDANGYYYGFSIHPMVLGSVAGCTFVNCLHEAAEAGTRKSAQIWVFLSCIALLTGFLASSRVSLGASCCGAVVYLLKRYRGHYGQGFLFVGAFAVAMVICMQFEVDFWGGIRNKIGPKISIHEIASSREVKWNDRLAEFRHSPIFGVGAHSINPEVAEDTDGLYTGMVEPGNAWLFFLSSMGILGFLAFSILFWPPVWCLWRFSKSRSDGTLLLAQLVFYGVYMNAEAHITSAGDYTYAYAWLVIALVQRENWGYMKGRFLSMSGALRIRNGQSSRRLEVAGGYRKRL